MASREHEEHERHRPSHWEGEAPHASPPQWSEPWRREPAHTGPGPQDGADPGSASGSGLWGSHSAQTPSGYSGPSGTGYGQTCEGHTGYGQTEFDPTHRMGGVSYAGTTGYAGYAGARHNRAPGSVDPQPLHSDGYDVDYQQWRDEQLRKLDDDYQAWRQTRYRKFADEFNAWRLGRQDGPSVAPPTDAARPIDALSKPSSSQPQ